MIGLFPSAGPVAGLLLASSPIERVPALEKLLCLSDIDLECYNIKVAIYRYERARK